MDPQTFTTTDPFIDKIAEIVDSALTSEELSNLRKALADLSKAIGPRYSASLTVVLDVVDDERETSLPLLTTGLGIGTDGSPYRTWGDSSSQRYLVNGEIEVVPHDRCPKCWEVWDFKFQNHTCEHCGTTLGKECKVLLDTDVCPHCEEGKVSLQKPKCNKCGFKIDLNMVAWG